MTKVAVIVPRPARRWHQVLIERLRAAGFDVSVSTRPGGGWPIAMDLALALERQLLRGKGTLSARMEIDNMPAPDDADLRIDLAGADGPAFSPTLRIAFDGGESRSVVTALAAGRLPDIEVLLDGRAFERAAPMVDNRVFVAAAADDVFARAITLMLKAARRVSSGDRTPLAGATGEAQSSRFVTAYLGSTIPRVAGEVLRRARYRFAHWRVGYRFIDGAGVAQTGALGTGWSVLPDGGSRFYADPFPFELDGRHYIFVEDYIHATGKAIISVSTIGADGIAGPPVPVLEEPHHLSYPQIFRHGDDIWMLPEASQSGKLTIYRAERFPDRWVPAAHLLTGEISDATLLQHAGKYWLFATDRDGAGSTSDTLVVYHAPDLMGPWTPHVQNPILIDRRRARPGGAFVRVGDSLVLPVQDGTTGYGGGLGLSKVLRLDEAAVELSDAVPITPEGDFPYPQIHTLNRAGRLEVIDGIAAVRR